MAASPCSSSASRRSGWQRCFCAGPAGSRRGLRPKTIRRARRAAARNRKTKINNGACREIDVSYQPILYEVSDKIATITLNRPDRMNAWTPVMGRDVRHAMESAAADDGVRVIVLTGGGRAFCAGADIEALKGIDPNEIRRGGKKHEAFIRLSAL